jgi:DNA/RNA endonuclease G (NUC1)
VTVPAKLWKVILVLPSEQAQPTPQTRAIAVIFPNDQSVEYDWARFRVPVSEVEELTNYRFWPAIPAPVATALKAKVDTVHIHPSKPR